MNFKRLGLLYQYKKEHCINLRPYYENNNGWSHDKIDTVIKGLSKVRFFNRFDKETLT
jgi:hypothetical protein